MAKVARFGFLALLLSSAASQFGKKDTKVPAVKEDVPFLLCSTCKELAKQLSRQAHELRESKGSKLRESDLLEAVESACDPEAESGEWLAALDVVEAGSSLRLAPQPGPGHCASECRTLARACALALGDHDTDVAEALFTRPPNAFGRAHLERLLCHDLSPACAKPAPPVPASRPPGPAFRAKTQQEVDMDKMMRKMRSVPGMPGMSMYSRDDLAGLAAEAGGEGEEYEEEGGEGAGGGGGGGDGEGAGGAGGAGGGVGGAGLAGWAQSAAGAASRAVDAAVHAAVGLAQRAWGWAERLGGGGGAAREGGAQEL